MQNLYPFRFQPLLRRYIWGGRRLETVLGKRLPAGDDYAESWEVVDHRDDQSVVAHGSLVGTTLSTLLKLYGKALLGQHDPRASFPLLFKFLDAQRRLSVQVHPNDAQGATLDPPDLGKTEAWVIIAAEPGSCLYAGLKRGVDRATLERELSRGTAELCLHKIEPQPGDCMFIPAGTVHALGAGLVVAEIQQSSDTTFRLFDWNRLGADGKPRPLHIEQGLDVINFDRGPVDPQVLRSSDQPGVERLVVCDKFVLDRRHITASHTIGGDDRCHILVVLDGRVRFTGDPSNQPLNRGQTILVPADCDTTAEVVDRHGSATLLDMYLP